MYPLLNNNAKLPAQERKQIFTNVRHIFIGNLSGKITNSTDNILISKMVGTFSVGAYSSYSSIISVAKNMFIQLHTSTNSSMGNLVAEGDYEKTEQVMRRLTFITFCPAIIAATGIFAAATPFVNMIYGEVYILPEIVVFVCAVNLFIYAIKNPLWSVVGVSGLFAKDKNISITGDVINLLVSILLGRKLGIAGILIGTSCTLIVQHILKIRLLFRDFLHLSCKIYLLQQLMYVGVCLFCMFSARAICKALPITNLCLATLVYGVCSVALTGGVIILLFHRTSEFKYALYTAKRMLKKLRCRNDG